MPLHGCNARVGVSDIQVKCGSTVWTQYMKMFADSQGKQVVCEKCHQEWETLAEKLEVVILEDMNSHLPEWWEKLTKGKYDD